MEIHQARRLKFALVAVLSFLTYSQAHRRELSQAISPQITVNANGGGDYTTVQAAVNAVPDGNPQHLVIRIVAGNYV